MPTLGGRTTRELADKLRADQQKLQQVPVPRDMQLPLQAAGARPSRALPYELHTSARCRASGQVELVFANSGTQAAVFHVYDGFKLDRIPRRYAVEAGKTLSDTWDAARDNFGKYDLWVLGPNGFHRHFKGDLNRLTGTQAAPEVRVCYDVANGNVYVDLMNKGGQPCVFTVTPVAYRQDGPWTANVAASASTTQHWELQASGQWYDFAVTCSSDASFYRRFSGRVETGKHAISDPAMSEA
jgi:phospholipase C